MLDIISLLLFVLMTIAPVVTIIFVWRKSKLRPIVKLLLGILFGALIGGLLFIIGLLILFRDGIPFR